MHGWGAQAAGFLFAAARREQDILLWHNWSLVEVFPRKIVSQGGEIGRRAKLRIAKSSISTHRFLFQSEALLRGGETPFLLKSRNAANGEQKGRHSSTNSSTASDRSFRSRPPDKSAINQLHHLFAIAVKKWGATRLRRGVLYPWSLSVTNS